MENAGIEDSDWPKTALNKRGHTEKYICEPRVRLTIDR